MLEFISGSCFLILLSGFGAFICFGSVLFGIFEGEKFAVLKNILLSLCGILFIGSIVYSGFRIYKSVNPPETIVENGITYHLADDIPEEKITEYGHEYILRGDKND